MGTYWDREAYSTATRCVWCKKDSETGTHGGCLECGRVKYTDNGRRPPRPDRKGAA